MSHPATTVLQLCGTLLTLTLFFISAFDSRYTFPALGLGTVSAAIRYRTVASLTKRIRLWAAALAAGLGYVTKTVLFNFYR